MIRKSLFSLLFATLVLVPALAAGPTPGKIVPGKGIEEVQLGQARKQVEAKLGAPQGTDRNEFNPKDTYALYYSRGIEIVYTDGKVSMITLHPPDKEWKAYPGATAQGLWVGSSLADAPKVLGAPAEERPGVINYPKVGVLVQYKAQQITCIILRAPGSR